MINLNAKNKLSTKLLMALVISTTLVACKSTPMKPAAVEDKSPSATAADTSKPATDSGADTAAIKEAQIDSSASMDDKNNPLKDPNNILSKRNIYFDYNSDAVKAEYRPIVEAHSKYLLAHPNAKMVVQGNTDERGTREYNVSLGQRRSVAVKKALNLLGVKDSQIETISYGEEKALQNCDSEDCFAKNRRADVVYEGD